MKSCRFKSKHLKSSRSWGHEYSFRIEVKNPTSKALNYAIDLVFRDETGFLVGRTRIAGGFFSRAFLVPAGHTRTLENTATRIFFDNDPSEVTVEPAILGVVDR